MDDIVSVLTYMAVVSAANERIIELLKSLLMKHAFKNSGIPVTAMHIAAALLGVGVVCLCPPVALPKIVKIEYPMLTNILIGISTASGSGFWHDLLSTMSDFRSGIKTSTDESNKSAVK